MPIYEYKCKKCGEKFDAYRPFIGSDKSVKCPKCGSKAPERLMSIFSSKGSSCGAPPFSGFG